MSIFEEIESIHRAASLGLNKDSSTGGGVTYEFTNCSSFGTNGPTQINIDDTYSGTTLDGDVLNAVNGIQQWEVAFTGIYTMTVIGAGGGIGHDGLSGGKAVSMGGSILLEAGTVLYICVGQEGIQEYGSSAWLGGGGGGMSLVAIHDKDDTLLIAAGGGGGSGSDDYSGMDANISNSGNNGSPAGPGPGIGGTSGAGGAGGGIYTGGGAGFLGDGLDGGSYAEGGNTYDSLVGGSGYGSGGHGGFGGGGGGFAGAGGGGGYSGGGGGGYNGGQIGYSAGGGGSFIHASFSDVQNTSGIESGHGSVTLVGSVIGAPPAIVIPLRKSIRL